MAEENGQTEIEAGNLPAETGIDGFDEKPGSLVESEVGAVSAVAREEAEIKAAIFVAKRFPRDEHAATVKLVRSARRPNFAEGAVYSYPRGSGKVTGPSVKLARELARCWGNIRYGLRIVSLDKMNVHVKGWAMDVETGTYVEMEDKFERLIYRKKGGWIKPDERDLRELINRRGAICVRNAILQTMPPDIVDEVVRETQTTMKKAASGDLEQDRDAAVRRMAIAFDGFFVTSQMLEAYLGHPLEKMTDEELADLRSIYASIRDRNTTIGDHFETQREQPTEGAEDLTAALQNGAASHSQVEVLREAFAKLCRKKDITKGADHERLLLQWTGAESFDAITAESAAKSLKGINSDTDTVLNWIEFQVQLEGKTASDA